MIRASLTFLVLALIAFLLGASGIAAVSVEISKILLIVFLALAVVSYLFSLISGKKTNLLP